MSDNTKEIDPSKCYTIKCTDQRDFLPHLYGPDLSVVIWSIFNYLRNKLKYEDLSEHDYEIYEGIRDHLNELVEDLPENLVW